MISLKNIHHDMNALLISGGPSALELLPKLKHVDRNKYIIFLESNALTQSFVETGLEPDYYLLPYPEKAKDNYFQNLIYQSLKAGISIKKFIKEDFYIEVDNVLGSREDLFEDWNVHKGIHKRFKYKKNIFLNNSPFDMIKNFPNMKILTRKDSFENHYPDLQLPNKFYFFSFNEEEIEGSFDNYINILEKDQSCYVNANNYTNSAAISSFPIMKYLGIEDVYLLGFDGNMLGVFENNADRIFKSRLHFYLFIYFCRHAFSHGFKINFPMYLRPKRDLLDVDLLVSEFDFNVYRIKGNSFKTAHFKNMPESSMSDITTSYN